MEKQSNTRANYYFYPFLASGLKMDHTKGLYLIHIYILFFVTKKVKPRSIKDTDLTPG